jgi:2-methylcitrate dehydratase PrpD
VVDKAKAVLLHGLIVGLASLNDADVALGLRVLDEEPSGGPARLIGVGRPTSRAMAAFHASLLIHVRGQDDSYRMLTHPGASVLPAALAEGQGRAVDGRALLAAIIAGYETQCRLARDIVPAVQNHGFRAGALFNLMGAAVAGRLAAPRSMDSTARTGEAC